MPIPNRLLGESDRCFFETILSTEYIRPGIYLLFKGSESRIFDFVGQSASKVK